MSNQTLPTKLGQICNKKNSINVDDDVFIVIDEIVPESANSLITVVSLNELQRNILNPDYAEKQRVSKKSLIVIADDLASYVNSWNENPVGNTPKTRLTPKQYLKLHTDKYIMVTYQFGNPIYIAPLKDLEIQITPNKEEAEIWSELDITETKLKYHISITGYHELKFEKL